MKLLCMPFERKQLGHRPPDWVSAGDVYFITICLEKRHSKQLIEPEVAEALYRAADFYQNMGYWWLQLLVLMPDHLHALISFNQRERSMSETLRNWKRYLNRSVGVEWQRGYFDHRLRSADAAREKACYIRNNPVRAGLIGQAADWPYTWPRR